MILLDTNVLIYAEGREHPHRDACTALIAASAKAELAANVDVETLQELLHVYDKRGERNRGLAVIARLRTIFHNPVPITALDIDRAAELLSRHQSLAARDAIHAAVALNRDAEAFVSADKAFATVEGLNSVDPVTFAKQLLG